MTLLSATSLLALGGSVLEYDADGGRLLQPTADEWAALVDGRLAEVEGTPVLEARLVERFARYAIEHGAWSTPLTEAFLELPAWHHCSHRIWWPRLLL